MPTPDENMQSVRNFAEEVFGNKNLKYAADPGTTPDKKGAVHSCRIFFAASRDMTAEIHARSRLSTTCDQSHVPRHRQRRIFRGGDRR